jgi:hypothetical protein
MVETRQRWQQLRWSIYEVGSAAGTVVLVLVLVLMIPPDGVLSDNEENYFALAARFVDGNDWPQTTAVFDASKHLILSNSTVGPLVSTIGYAPAQIITRLLAVMGYALALTALFRVFGLLAVDAALAVMIMGLIGQDIIGGEWLFSGYEAKVASYLLVLAALRLVLVSQRLTTATVLFALATCFHFLVGGFWFMAGMALRLLDRPGHVKRVVSATALYALLTLPLFGLIAWSRLADARAEAASDVPSPDVIYSIIREPHHQSPFLSWAYFRDHWLPGYLLAALMLLSCVRVARTEPRRRLRVTALWLTGLLGYLFFVLGPKFLDRDTGMLGKFYLFRPSSLILLFWLMLALAVIATALGARPWILRAVLMLLIGPAFLYVQGGALIRQVVASETLEQQKQPMVAEVKRLVAPGDVVLIDPDVEAQWLDFERRTGRPTLVMWKFTPTNDADLVTWYRRTELRRLLFEQGCGPGTHDENIAYLLTSPERSSRLAASCGPEILRAGQWVLLRLETRLDSSPLLNQ